MADSMRPEDWQNVVLVMRAAPLKNMAQAEDVNRLIAKVSRHAQRLESVKPVGVGLCSEAAGVENPCSE